MAREQGLLTTFPHQPVTGRGVRLRARDFSSAEGNSWEKTQPKAFNPQDSQQRLTEMFLSSEGEDMGNTPQFPLHLGINLAENMKGVNTKNFRIFWR